MLEYEAVSRYTSSHDGLRLHYLDVPARLDERRIPAVCLPGLSRSTDDFIPLATKLARTSTTPRRVLAFDYRGRGRSDHDPDWRHYDLETERTDYLRILEDLGIQQAHLIGTSRGGLHILGLAAARRDLICTAVFNDIGPVLEVAGLARIKSYIGNAVSPKNIDEAIALLRRGVGKHFDALSPAEWRHFAETTFGRDETRLGLRYDPQLALTLDGIDLANPLPDSWQLFDKLEGAPVLTIRGANSDLLSEVTLASMGNRWPGNETTIVPGQGHAPLLVDDATLSSIDRFLAEADSKF